MYIREPQNYSYKSDSAQFGGVNLSPALVISWRHTHTHTCMQQSNQSVAYFHNEVQEVKQSSIRLLSVSPGFSVGGLIKSSPSLRPRLSQASETH